MATLRTIRTLRPLRSAQWWWRARYLLERKLRSTAPHRIPYRRAPGAQAPPLRDDLPDVPLFHLPGLTGSEAVAALAEGRWEHLNRSRIIGRVRPHWGLGLVESEKLWTLELYGHHWACALAEHAAAAPSEAGLAETLFEHYVGDWIQRCGPTEPGAHVLAWNSFVLATRTVNWIRSYRRLHSTLFARRPAFRTAFLRTLWEQCAFLHDHIEWDLRGNHLFRDAVGLAWGGRFFEGDEPRRWLRTAEQLARSQVSEQVLQDGGHFERSTMYQLQMMEEVLALAHLLDDAAAPRACLDAWQLMAEFLAWMRHPDGHIAIFNDATVGFHGSPEDAFRLGAAVGRVVDPERRRGARHFPNTGYAAWQGDPWTVFLDAGPVGPDVQSSHAHADTLSMECSCGTDRLIVDPGTFGYDLDDRRRYDRSTSAHNTVTIDDTSSSEVWHIFRTGRRAKPIDVRVEATPAHLDLSAAHDGYDHLPGRPRHRRRVVVGTSIPLTVEDEVLGRGRHAIEGGFLVAPSWRCTPQPGGWQLARNGRRVLLSLQGPPRLQLYTEKKTYHPDFGVELEAERVGWRIDGDLPVRVVARFDLEA